MYIIVKELQQKQLQHYQKLIQLIILNFDAVMVVGKLNKGNLLIIKLNSKKLY